MRKNIFILLLFVIFHNGYSQEKTEVLLLGTYHFGGNTIDKLKVTNDGILSDKKQQEIEILLNKIEKFKPEKIYVENEPNQQHFWDSIYFAYNENKAIRIKNEIFQIGIKLASRLKFKFGVTCVDWHIDPANTFAEKEYLSLYQKMLDYHTDNNLPDEEPESEYFLQSIEYSKEFNAKIPDMELLDVYRIMNSENNINDSFYGNISSMLDIDAYNVNVFWSQNNMIRNVNIYKNIIQDILKTHPKRVMILFGTGHIKALKDYLEAHPAIKIAETQEYLK